jgi:hypothetical protein
LGLTADDEWKLANLRPHIWKVSQLIARFAINQSDDTNAFSGRSKKEDKPTSVIHSNAIDMSTLDITPTNIFFFPQEANGDAGR